MLYRNTNCMRPVSTQKIKISNNQQRIMDVYDLHGYTLASANIRVEEIILSCIKNNFKEILLITGKGIHSNIEENTYVSKDLSKLKYSVPEYIKSNLSLIWSKVLKFKILLLIKWLCLFSENSHVVILNNFDCILLILIVLF